MTIDQDSFRPPKLRNVLAELEAPVPDARLDDRRRSTILTPLTGLIGREAVLGEVRPLLRSNRLLTLTGTGGCGKTRLALELARAAADDFPDGATLVELGAISDPDLVAPTVALNVGLRQAAESSPAEALARHYADRCALLVLDNCEHLIGACADLVNLLVRRCPKLSILATSREPLGMAGEVAWRVPSLRAMKPDDVPRWDSDAAMAASSYAATQLFVERARAVSPSFAIDAQNVGPVVQICWRLDGIPLALELAAALASALSPAQISQRLDDRFSLLTVGNRAALPRQRTLLATLDWSHSLLTDGERTVFRRLAIFAGSFSLEAAERVCAADPLRQAEVLACLVRLVEKSLVIAQPRHGEIRYRLLETIRQYAHERLAEAGEVEDLASRHRSWFVDLVGGIGNGLWDENQAVWFNRLQDDMDNLRIVLGWYRDNDPTTGLVIASSLWRFWVDRGFLREGRQWLRSLLEKAPDRSAIRAQAFLGLGYIESVGIGFVGAEAAFEECLSIFEEIGDAVGAGAVLVIMANRELSHEGDYARARLLLQRALSALRHPRDRVVASNRAHFAWACTLLATLTFWQGDSATAEALFDEGLAAFRSIGDTRGISVVLRDLAEFRRQQGKYDLARQALETVLGLARETGIRRHIAGAFNRLAALAYSEGDYRRATGWIAETLALSRDDSQDYGVSMAHFILGKIAIARGADAEGEKEYQVSLHYGRANGSRLDVSRAVDALGVLSVQVGSFARGVRLIAAAGALIPNIPPFEASDGDARKVSLGRAKAALGVVHFDDAWQIGQALDVEAATSYALEGAELHRPGVTIEIAASGQAIDPRVRQ
jgi:non-specific serine/threonine protein kinase